MKLPLYVVFNNKTLAQEGGVGSQASMDDPGMFRVSRESTDTLTGGVRKSGIHG